MKKPSISHIVHRELFPSPSPSDPDSFLAFVHSSLVPEVRFEVYTYYGSLESIEARYPGLDYTSSFHRKRLERWPAHRSFFRAMNKLQLTSEEIYKLCCWEGTKIARDSFERQHGVVFDTTMPGMQSISTDSGRPPTITVHCYDEQGLETTPDDGNNKESVDEPWAEANQRLEQPETNRGPNLVLPVLPSRNRRQPIRPDTARSSRHPAGQWDEYQEWLKSVEDDGHNFPPIPPHLLFRRRHQHRRHNLFLPYADDNNSAWQSPYRASADVENDGNELYRNISRSFSVHRRAAHNLDQGSPSSSRIHSNNNFNLPPLQLSGPDSEQTRPIISNELTMSPSSYEPPIHQYPSRGTSASSVVPASRVDTSISENIDPFISMERSTSRQRYHPLQLPSSSSSSSSSPAASTSWLAPRDECLSPSGNGAGTVISMRASPTNNNVSQETHDYDTPQHGLRLRGLVPQGSAFIPSTPPMSYQRHFEQ